MPFGVTNAPAVFQRLMQQVLAGMQSELANTFVSVYLDDVIVFSKSLGAFDSCVQSVEEGWIDAKCK